MFHKEWFLLVVLFILWNRNADAAAQDRTRLNIPGSFQMPVWGPSVGWPTLARPSVGWPFMTGNSPLTALSCREEGLYRHPKDCTMFYRCISISGSKDYSYLSFKCQDGTIFSPEHGGGGGGVCIAGTCALQDLLSPATAVIEDQNNLLMLNQGITSISSSGILQGPKYFSEGRYPDTNDCGQFYEVIANNDGQLIANIKSCFGNAFDASLHTCVSPHMVKGCSPAQYTSLRSNAVEYPGLQKICSNYKNKYLCADCKTSVMCIDYIGYPMPCQDGSACSMNKEGFSGGVCHPNIHADCNCPKQDILNIDLYDPTKFLNCTTDSVDPVVHSCPEGSLFNNDTKDCGTPTNSCLKSGRGTFAPVNDCARYYTCILTSNGWIQNWFTCPRDEMFNQDSQKCEDPCEWNYGNFTCTGEGRFSNPINCSTYYECFKEPLDSEKFIQVASVCPDGYEWTQDGGYCITSGTSKKRCVPLTSKPSTCSIPTEMCRSKALTACVYKYEFCSCEDDSEVSPYKCTPCAEGHASNTTGCFPLCNMLTCGANEICLDKEGQAPGVCTCASGYAREGELCKDVCSNLTCGDNEICLDEDGQEPGICTCALGYAREGELCKALCNMLTCGANEICLDKDGQEPGVCTCALGYAREGELCKDICENAGGVKISDQCLLFNSGTGLTWINAVMTCGAKGQQLASLADPQAVVNYMKNKNIGSYHWVAMSDEASEGTWEWMDGRPLGHIPWARGGADTGSNCVVVLGNGFHDTPCTSKRYYICSLDTVQPPSASEASKEGLVRLEMVPKQCPDDSFKVNEECFFIPNEGFQTYGKAQDLCKSMGGFLAEPNSIVEFLEALTNMTTGYNFWIGSVNQKDYQNWRWSPDKAMIGQSSHWSTGKSQTLSGIEEEDGDCQLVMRGEHLPLYRGKCTDYHLFVCEKY